jgi:uncharacterized protein YhaN
MRFNRLDLIKYGKFTDRSVEFPVAKQDFHLIVGPNEAGKSTLRSAIVDLLFGIHPRSLLSFLHPLNELRLGANISNTSGSLEFHRTKAQKQTLRSPLDAVLPDTALIPFVGTADRNFFDQMFGLDHARLVEGGNSILNDKSDVGQILYQSAVGVASLGKIRDALAAEADKLWAPRKSTERAYYIASDQLEKATAALKDTTVRTKVWVEANSKVESLQEALIAERDRHQHLQSKRISLERIRRLAPFLISIRSNENKLSELGEVIELPIDAADIFAAAEREMAIAQQRLELRNAEVEKTTDDLGKINVDEALLGFADDINKLDNLRLQYIAYDRDIDRQKHELAALWQDVCRSCNQLGWIPESETAIANRLPTLLVQRELRRLVSDHSGMTQALRAAEQAERSKLSEIESLTEQLAGLQIGEIKPALHAVLAKARSFGDSGTTIQKQQTALSKAKIALESLLLELGQWGKDLPDLKAMQPPSQEKISRLVQQRQVLIADQKAELIRLKNQKAEVARIELDIAQFKELHHPTTHDTVIQARNERDSSWQAIKAGKSGLQEGAENFEATIIHADNIADKRLDDVEEATKLQTLVHQLEREKQTLLELENQCSNLKEEILLFDDQWAEQAVDLGLRAMPLEEIGGWIIRREKALAAAAMYQDSQNDYDSFGKSISDARLSLANVLRETGVQIAESDSLAVLCIQAESYIQAIDGAKVRQETLNAQLQAAKTLAASLKQSTDDAKAEQSRWTEAWSTALVKAGLLPSSDIGTVEGALELIGQIEEKLGKMRQIQVQRIDAMNADLKDFSFEANRLAQIIAPDLVSQLPAQIAQGLANRLIQASESYKESSRLKESLRIATIQVLEAKESIQTAMASLKHLLERAGVDSNDLLAEAIRRSDEYRRLNGELTDANAKFLNGGDGLTRIQIEAEIDAADLVQLVSELEKINGQIADTVLRQSELSADNSTATRVLSDIGGFDTAALAEAQRQEALSTMSDVAERYIKVFTAQRLLRWSIDRYREEKQGPLLIRAGSIFSTLTSGSFQKLVVDYERESMALEGQRSDGKLVGVSGLSDGTRDQLYLALRLAALEMHLDQSMPLPFIADDLFINYDDERSKAGFEALRELSEQTQVIFLSHHDHLIPTVQEVFGKQVNIVNL